MIYRVRHTTAYTYSEAVSVCHNQLHLRPRESANQTCAAHTLQVQPLPAVSSQHRDYFGNHVTFLAVQEPHRTFTVTARSTVEVRPVEIPSRLATPAWEVVRERLWRHRDPATLEAYQYLFDSPYVRSSPALRRYVAPSFAAGRPLLTALLDLTRRLHTDFTYDPKATTVSTPLHEVLRYRRGVCQDFAHVQIGCLRALGLAARYVSGYLVTQPPAGQPRLVGSEASHAWVAVYCPDVGWIDIDPTNNLVPSDRHITVAVGRDYSDVSPIKGVFLGGGQHTVNVAVEVVPVEA